MMIRQKRINNCLDQLRSLLPFTTTMKRDMASLLEQTVEYINTMHTVLNEEKPACLSKVYVVYQQKIEEHDFFRKATTPKNSKRKYSSGGSGSSCSYGMIHQAPSPQIICQGYPSVSCDQGVLETDSKRQCSGLSYDQSILQQGVSTPTGSCTWQPQHQIIEQAMGNINNNNNNFMTPFYPYGSECKSGVPNSSRYIFGQSPLNSLGTSQKQNQQMSPYTSTKFLPQFSKMCAGIPKPIVQCVPPTSTESRALQEEVTPSQTEDMTKNNMDDVISKAHKSQNLFNVSNLVANHNKSQQEELACTVMQMTNPSQWYHDYSSAVNPFNPLLARSDNPTVNLLAPMDMSLSPPNDNQSTSPQFLGVNRLLSRDRPSNFHGFNPTSRDMGIILKNPVSNMLNEVSGINSTDYAARSFGSTEKKVTPLFSSTKWTPQLSTANNRDFFCGIPITKARSTSAPAAIVSDVMTQSEVFAQSAHSSPTEKLWEETVRLQPSPRPAELKDSPASPEIPVITPKKDDKITEITDQSSDTQVPTSSEEKVDVNNNPNEETAKS